MLSSMETVWSTLGKLFSSPYFTCSHDLLATHDCSYELKFPLNFLSQIIIIPNRYCEEIQTFAVTMSYRKLKGVSSVLIHSVV